LTSLRVADVMCKDVERVAPHTSLEEVARCMRETPYSCVVVCDEDLPVGMVTDRDVARVLAETLGGRPTPRSAADAMSFPVPSVEESASASLAASECRARHAQRLAVLDQDGALIGIVSRADLRGAQTREAESRCMDLERMLAARNAELERTREALRDASLMDELLEIGNVRAMEFALDRVHAAAVRYGRPYAVALVDLDRFRTYNERLGAVRGDEALRRVSGQLRTAIRRADSLYRRDGDHLFALLPETDAEGAAGLAERMRTEVEALALFNEGAGVPLTVSVGFAAWTPGASETAAASMLARAERALQRAQQGGRNRVARDPE